VLQSDREEIHLLLALPKEAERFGEGFRERGGFLVDLDWKGCRLTSASVMSDLGKRCALVPERRYPCLVRG